MSVSGNGRNDREIKIIDIYINLSDYLCVEILSKKPNIKEIIRTAKALHKVTKIAEINPNNKLTINEIWEGISE